MTFLSLFLNSILDFFTAFISFDLTVLIVFVLVFGALISFVLNR